MAIIDCVQWAPQEAGTIYAWKYPATNLSTYTQLIVQESQEALLFSKGQLMQKFGPGKHTLNTENIPVLRSLFGLPFGGKNPFTAEVWFVNKILAYNIPWRTTRMMIHDNDYQTQIPLYASGQYGLQVKDAEKFLIKMVGPRAIFRDSDLTEQFAGEFTTKTKASILQFMISNRIGIKQVSAYLDQISQHLREVMNPFWDDLGIELTRFYVSDIDVDDTTPEGRKVREAIGQQSSMSITGHTWQQEQMFGTANNALSGLGGGQGGPLGAVVALGMMGGFGGGGMAGGQSGLMNPQYQQPTFGGQQGQPMGGMQGGMGMQGGQPQQPKMVYCANCSKQFPSNHAFCPNCGKKYNPCPNCGSDNDEQARRCITCGQALAGAAQAGGNLCPNCRAPLAPGAAFCSHCGKPVPQTSDNCPRCGSPMKPGAKFCPRCGAPRS